jgi:hypothetical protein
VDPETVTKTIARFKVYTIVVAPGDFRRFCISSLFREAVEMIVL